MSNNGAADAQRVATQNSQVLSIAGTMTMRILRQVLGKAVSDKVAGSPIKDAALSGLVTTHLKNEIDKK